MPEKYPRKRDIPVFMISYVVNIGYLMILGVDH